MTREEMARVLSDVIVDRYLGAELTDLEADKARFALAALRGPEWVRTEDRLPLNFENELVVMGGKITLGIYDHNCWFFYNEDKNKWQMDEYDLVTHWMPLPKLPEVEG